MSLAAGDHQPWLYASSFQRTRCNHSLNEVANIAQHHAEALHWIRVARLGFHSLDLHALQDRMLYKAATGFENAPV